MPNERDPANHFDAAPVGNPAGESLGKSQGSPDSGSGTGDSRPNRRRRGNRGGKGRTRSGSAPRVGDAATQAQSTDLAGQPDLPDLPWEGQPPGASEHEPVSGDESTLSSSTARPPRPPRPPRPKQPRPQQDTQRVKSANDKATEQPSDQLAEPKSERKIEGTGDAAVERNGERTSERSAGRNRNRRSGPRDGRTRNRSLVKFEYTMCVHVQPNVTQIAVLEGRTLIEHYVSHAEDDAGQIHGNIYFGRVQNVLPGMEAAFVDIATPKNAVLYRGDVQFDRSDVDAVAEGKQVRIEELLKNGQLVICQVTKNPIGSKGARLTQDVSIAGRFVVLVPNSSTYGISKRLPDDERKRLRGVLDEVKPSHHGIIVRTAAAGADADELRRDVQMLVAEWDRIAAKAAKLRGPALLHREPNLAVRIIREEFSDNYQKVIIDDRSVYDEVRQYVEVITPDLADRIIFFDRALEPLPVFEQFHVHEQLHKAIDRKVWLPSGGSIIIERTEALTVIDVNTGKNVGSTSLEETVFRNNLEAATEIARQLRLRDIGGIIVIDFIDMEIKPNRAAVMSHFRDELSKDKTRTQVFDISELGLVEMTRKRISEGLIEALSDVCPTCHGRGFVFDPSVLTE